MPDVRPKVGAKEPRLRLQRVGLEAGPLSQWLFGALAEAELSVVCVETRHCRRC